MTTFRRAAALALVGWDAQALRYNNRKTNDGSRFVNVKRGATGRRLTYQKLTGEDQVVT